MPIDDEIMRHALRLARRGLGNTWPNPAVGCVIGREEGGAVRVLGRGWTQPGGRPHAEAMALDDARARHGEAALRGATAWVSLEPCSHHGRTPPCADALVAAGIARVVSACGDPDPRVAGDGLARLRDAGIAVVEGVLAGDALDLNAGFFTRVREGRPLVALKLATSADGRIATHTGASQWITGAPARRHAHLMRARFDAIAVGIGTALADDPSLTCRLAGLEARSPDRVVFDTRLRLPVGGALARSAREVPVTAICGAAAEAGRRAALEGEGVRVVEVACGADGRVDPAAALAALGATGVTRLMVEGGAGLGTALLRAGLVDRVAWYRAPGVIGGDGLPVLEGLGVDAPDGMARFASLSRRPLGDDTLEIFARVA